MAAPHVLPHSLRLICKDGTHVDAYAEILSVVSPVLADLISIAKQGASGSLPELKCTADSADDWALLLSLINPALRARLPDHWVSHARHAREHQAPRMGAQGTRIQAHAGFRMQAPEHQGLGRRANSRAPQ